MKSLRQPEPRARSQSSVLILLWERGESEQNQLQVQQRCCLRACWAWLSGNQPEEWVVLEAAGGLAQHLSWATATSSGSTQGNLQCILSSVLLSRDVRQHCGPAKWLGPFGRRLISGLAMALGVLSLLETLSLLRRGCGLLFLLPPSRDEYFGVLTMRTSSGKSSSSSFLTDFSSVVMQISSSFSW